ncbi:hypothetical protein [Streptomyces sp. NPDC056401]|uniref:hypothetical protein n=1 Tax=Streptomyces sp. NPDC056401 TaxID=3345809 RepID=UPI0035DDA2B2
MSRVDAQVKFPDGTIKHGIYNGTVDVYMPWLFDTEQEAWNCWQKYRESGFDSKQFDKPFDDTFYDVEIADDYGGGDCYIGRASKSQIVSSVNTDYMNRKGKGGKPDWWLSYDS